MVQNSMASMFYVGSINVVETITEECIRSIIGNENYEEGKRNHPDFLGQFQDRPCIYSDSDGCMTVYFGKKDG